MGKIQKELEAQRQLRIQKEINRNQVELLDEYRQTIKSLERLVERLRSKLKSEK